MSSHREAPSISQDPVADNTDLYAFVSPDRPDTVTFIANYIPLEGPAGGPELLRVRQRRPVRDQHRQQRRQHWTTSRTSSGSRRTVRQPQHVPLQHRTDHVADQSRAGTAFRRIRSHAFGAATVAELLGSGLTVPAGEHRAALDARLRRRSPRRRCTACAGGIKVFAGQRREGFFVDLGSIFDLGDLRPFQNLHLIPTTAAPGVDSTKDLNVHTIAIQVPKTQLTNDGSSPTNRRGCPIGHRRVRVGQPSQVADPGGRQRGGSRSVGPGVAARQSAHQRSRHPDEHEGPVELGLAFRRRASSSASCSIPNWRASCPSCIRASSRTWPRTRSRGRIWRRSS